MLETGNNPTNIVDTGLRSIGTVDRPRGSRPVPLFPALLFLWLAPLCVFRYRVVLPCLFITHLNQPWLMSQQNIPTPTCTLLDPV